MTFQVSDAAQTKRSEMYAANPFQIGTFGANLSSGRTATTVPERWSGSWDDCMRMAQIADAGGIDFILPVGRWKGYGGESDFHGTGLETITWATGLLAHTKRVTVFGWNQDEFEMFGIEQRPHDERYIFAEEWLQVMTRAWTSEEPFDIDGKYFHLKNVIGKPKPYGQSRPLIMNAGASGPGQTFAMRNCDASFTGITNIALGGAQGGYATAGSLSLIDSAAKRVAEIKENARQYGRPIEVYTQGQIVCRASQKEAEEYHHWANVENAEWPAVERLLELNKLTRTNTPPDVYEAKRLALAKSGIGGRPFVGSPDFVAEELGILAKAGVRGIAVSFVNYNNDLPFFCAEVLPRLKKMGFRT
jgi:FMNH2-dependent dimethyl sulfone monooxygenase